MSMLGSKCAKRNMRKLKLYLFVEPKQSNLPAQPTTTITTIKGAKTVNENTRILTWKTPLNVRE